MRRRTTVCIAVFSSLALQACSKPVQVIVPDGFTGEAKIVLDTESGMEPQREGIWWVFRIPSSGELRVGDHSVLYRWHYTVVRHANGSRASVGQQFTRAGTRRRGPNLWESSTNFDGTTHVWIIEDQDAR